MCLQGCPGDSEHLQWHNGTDASSDSRELERDIDAAFGLTADTDIQDVDDGPLQVGYALA